MHDEKLPPTPTTQTNTHPQHTEKKRTLFKKNALMHLLGTSTHFFTFVLAVALLTSLF